VTFITDTIRLPAKSAALKPAKGRLQRCSWQHFYCFLREIVN